MSDGFDYKITIQNNAGIVLAEKEKAIQRALYNMGVKAVEGSVDAITGKYSIEPAVKTGRLRASISFITSSGDMSVVPSGEQRYENKAVKESKNGDKLSGKAPENAVIVGSNVEYAEYVHNGTSKMPGRPFLREGIEQTKDDMQRQVEKIFKGEL